MKGTSRPTAMVCPSCGRLVNYDARECPNCGRKAHVPRSWTRSLDRLYTSGLSFAKVFVVGNAAVAALLIFLSLRQGAEFGAGPVPTLPLLLRFGALRDVEIADGQWWRLITYLFLHGGLLHVFFNCMFLMVLGPQVEALFGRARFVVAYLGAGVLAGLASLYGHHGTGIPSVGCSGALFGLFGLMGVYGLRRRDAFGRALFTRVAIFALINAVIGLSMPMIDNWAHGGGLAAGALLGLVLDSRDRTLRGEGPGVRLLASAFLAATGLSLVIGTVHLFAGTVTHDVNRVREDWARCLRIVQSIEEYAYHLDATDKAGMYRMLAPLRRDFQELHEDAEGKLEFLGPILEVQRELGEQLRRDAPPGEIAGTARRLDELMRRAPLVWTED